MSESFDPDNSECRIYVRRVGLLAAVGHDIELRVGDYRVDVDRSALRVAARFSAHSLRVIEAVEGRARRPGKLSVRDKAQIEAAIVEQVLHADRYPTISFQSSGVEPRSAAFAVRGQLTLRGVARESAFVVAQRAGVLSAEVIVHQPDFAIAPYRAIGGALRVHADVAIEFSAPSPTR